MTSLKEMTSKVDVPRSMMVVSDEEWEKMKVMISDQIDNVDASLTELKENGSLETIAQMIKRGDKIPSARLQAWYIQKRVILLFDIIDNGLIIPFFSAGITAC